MRFVLIQDATIPRSQWRKGITIVFLLGVGKVTIVFPLGGGKVTIVFPRGG